jgi:hypothetical protein
MVKCSRDEDRRIDAAVGPVGSGGGRSPSALSTGQATPALSGAPGIGALAPGQRWSVGRKREVVLRLMCGPSGRSREKPPWTACSNTLLPAASGVVVMRLPRPRDPGGRDMDVVGPKFEDVEKEGHGNAEEGSYGPI